MNSHEERVEQVKQDTLQKLNSAQADIIREQRAALDHIRNYVVEAAKTPITRESILAAPKVERKQGIPLATALAQPLICTYDPNDHHEIKLHDCAGFYGDGSGKFWCDVHEIHRLEAALKAQTMTALEQRDEMQGLCRLVLSETVGGQAI